MAEQYVIASSFMLVTGGIAVIVGFFALQYRESPGATPLAVMAAATALWAFGYGLPLFLPSETAGAIVWHSRHFWAALTALSWVFIAAEYLEVELLQRRGLQGFLVAVLALEALVLLTDPIHNQFIATVAVSEGGQFQDTPGPLFWVHAVFWIGLIVVTWFLFVREFLDAHGLYRRQLGTIIVGGAIGLALIIVQQALAPVPGFSLNMVGMTVVCITVLWAVVRVDFLETVPVARKTLVESMDDAVVALDDTNTVVDLNQAALDLLAVDADAIGTPGSEVFGRYPELVERFATTYDTETTIELEQGGETRYFDINISPVYPTNADDIEHAPILGRIIVIRDQTEQVRRQHQLEQQKQELERQNDRLDQFASVVSHDLRNPLNAARGYLDVAQETGDEEHFEKVATAHERMETMIGELLTLARAETTLDPADVESIRLATLADAAWETAETAGASLEIAAPADWTIEADRALVRNVLENLFRNATDHNDPPVTVSVGLLDTDAGFFVEDDGSGIPPDEQESVFEHGYTTSRDGTGIGLSIVNELVETHGWEIDVTESEPGGARFEIRIDGEDSL